MRFFYPPTPSLSVSTTEKTTIYFVCLPNSKVEILLCSTSIVLNAYKYLQYENMKKNCTTPVQLRECTNCLLKKKGQVFSCYREGRRQGIAITEISDKIEC